MPKTATEERIDRFGWRPGEGRFVWCDECSTGMVVPEEIAEVECGEHGRMDELSLVPVRLALEWKGRYEGEVAGREAWRRVATILKNAMIGLLDHMDNEVVIAVDTAFREAWQIPRDKPIDVIRETPADEVPPAPGEPR